MCFAPQLIERNLYADDRFIPTEVGLPLYLDILEDFWSKKFLVNWDIFLLLKNLRNRQASR